MRLIYTNNELLLKWMEVTMNKISTKHTNNMFEDIKHIDDGNYKKY